jgi:hypothetical protein
VLNQHFMSVGNGQLKLRIDFLEREFVSWHGDL